SDANFGRPGRDGNRGGHAQVGGRILRAEAAGRVASQRHRGSHQRLRGDRTRAAAHAAATLGESRLHEVRGAHSRDGGDEGGGGASQGWTRADRRGDGRGGSRQITAVFRVQGGFAVGPDGFGDVFGLARQSQRLLSRDRSPAWLFQNR